MNTDQRGWARIVGSVALAAGLASAGGLAHAATPVPSGKWSFVWKDAKGRADRPMRVYTYRPKQCDSTCPIVMVMHGASRTASNYRDYWELAADRFGFLVIAPEFSAAHWPKAAGYNLGDTAESGDREKWAYLAVEHLFDEMRDGQKDYRIFGHSAGAQFVHRMLFLVPENRISLAIMANAGWYTIPEWRSDKAYAKWPHTMVGAPSGGEASLRAALEKKAWVILGEADTDPNDPQLDKADASMKQGANRLERGEHFFGAVTSAAGALGAKLGWQLAYVPGVAHDGQKMSRAAADIAFGAKK